MLNVTNSRLRYVKNQVLAVVLSQSGIFGWASGVGMGTVAVGIQVALRYGES